MGISMISNVFAELLSILYQSGIGIKYVEKLDICGGFQMDHGPKLSVCHCLGKN